MPGPSDLFGRPPPDCEAVFVDLPKNRSRRYCNTGNCGNRQHVAAYRERLASRGALSSSGMPCLR